MAAHHHRAIDAGERAVVEIGAGESLDDEARRRRIAGRMVEADEIVVDRLRDVDRPQVMAALLRLFGDDAHGVGGIVAADVEERVDIVRLENLEDLLAIFDVRLVAGRAERGGGGRGDRLEVADRLLAEVDEVVVDDAAHPVDRAIDVRDTSEKRRASSATPTSDWLITAVGPPPWATRILCDTSTLPCVSAAGGAHSAQCWLRRRVRRAQDGG